MKNDSKELNQINNSIQELGANLYQRLRSLSALLKIISESLSESNAAAKAYAMVQTVLMLESINYEVASEISRLMIEVDACNIFPTVKEKRVSRQTIVDATELANDILADLPIGYRVVQDACKRDEIASENLASSEVVITGAVGHLRRLITKKNDLMAVLEITHDDETIAEIAVLPKTYARYREILDVVSDALVVRNFICDFDGESNILKEIRYTDDVEQVFAGLTRHGDFFYVAKDEDEIKQWLFEQNDNLIAPQDETESKEQQIKELVFRLGRAHNLRRFAEQGDDFHAEQHKRESELQTQLYKLGVSHHDIENDWQGYFEEGQGTYAVYGSWDENLPDVATLIADYEEALSEEMEGDS